MPRKKAIVGDLAVTQAALDDALATNKRVNKELDAAYSTIDELVGQRDKADAACARAKEELLKEHPPYVPPDPITAAIGYLAYENDYQAAQLRSNLVAYDRQREYAKTGKTSL